MGPYEDFPSYFIEKGNLFNSFLGGKTPKPSWDKRMEVESTRLDLPTLGPRRERSRVTPAQLTAREKLLALARRSLGQRAVGRVCDELDAKRGKATRSSGKDQFRRLERIVDKLSEEQVEHVFERLNLVVKRLDDEARLSSRGRTKVKKKLGASRPRGRAPSAHPLRNHGAALDTSGESSTERWECSLCHKRLTPEERNVSLRHAEVFLSQAYCQDHGAAVLALFGAASER